MAFGCPMAIFSRSVFQRALSQKKESSTAVSSSTRRSEKAFLPLRWVHLSGDTVTTITSSTTGCSPRNVKRTSKREASSRKNMTMASIRQRQERNKMPRLGLNQSQNRRRNAFNRLSVRFTTNAVYQFLFANTMQLLKNPHFNIRINDQVGGGASAST